MCVKDNEDLLGFNIYCSNMPDDHITLPIHDDCLTTANIMNVRFLMHKSFNLQ